MNPVRVMFALAAIIFSSGTIAAESVAPDDLVKNTANEVLQLIKQNRNILHISEIIDEKVLPHFDLERMSRIAMGKDWNGLTQEQQDTFLREFHKLITHTFASALSMGHDDSIRTKPLALKPGDKEATVDMLVTETGEEKEADMVAFRVEKVGNDWKVYDISSDGISFLATYRSQFASIKKQEGIDSLLQRLIAKNR